MANLVPLTNILLHLIFPFMKNILKLDVGIERGAMYPHPLFSFLSPERSTEFKIKWTNNISVTGIIPSNKFWENVYQYEFS